MTEARFREALVEAANEVQEDGRTRLQIIAERLLDLAASRNVAAIRELADRLDAIRLTGSTMVGGVPDFARSDERYEEAFREAGSARSLARLRASRRRSRPRISEMRCWWLSTTGLSAPEIRADVAGASDVAQQAGGDTAGWRGRVRNPRSGSTKRPSSG